MKYDDRVNTQDLGGEERYLMYVSTDKPIYREQETLYVRVVLLNAHDNTPCTGEADEQISVKIRAPKGDFVFEGVVGSSDSSSGFTWDIPVGTPGGQYTIIVDSLSLGSAQAQRSFDIRAYRAPRLKTQIEFMREGYGPGDQVRASVQVERAEGGIPAGASVRVVARVDGDEVFNESAYVVADDGSCTAEFSLPEHIEVGDGSLSFIIEDGGVVDTAVKTIPILLQTLDINFYPEGGDLVAGLEGRVYFQANRPDGKPADIRGRISNPAISNFEASQVAEISTTHEGRGVFSFTPESGAVYSLAIDSPSGISGHFPLPKQKNSGCVLKSLQEIFAYDDKISLAVASTKDQAVARVTLYKREVLIDTYEVARPVDALSSMNITLDAKDSEGVLIVTAWGSKGEPLAERLIFRQAKYALNVAINVTDGPLVPGAGVELEILTTDENGRPVEAVVGVSVTDDAVLEMIETREQAPRLPVMVYLENEVEDLADAHVYLDADNEASAEAVDLLLGTQGWRRFILLDYTQLKAEYPEKAAQVLAQKRPVAAPVAWGGMGGDAPWCMKEGIVREPVFDGGGAEGFLFADEAFDAPFAAAPQPLDKAALDEGGAEVEGADIAFNNEIDFSVHEEVLLVDDPEPATVPFIKQAEEEECCAWTDQGIQAIREYAHKTRFNRKPNDRVDFAETLYWNAGIRTGARDGRAKVNFDLSDSVTSFRVMSDAFGRNGALGSDNFMIHSLEPFYIEAKMPLVVTVGDIIALPVALVNTSNTDIETVNLLVRGEGVAITQVEAMSLAGGERARRIVRIAVDKPGDFSLNFSAAAGVYTDSVTRSLTVKPGGFPVAMNYGGLIGPQVDFEQQISIPDEIEPGSLTAQAKVYPSPVASMQEALNALLREPSGCFEQTSSTTYPLVMAQQYFTSHEGVNPEQIAKAKSLLEQGYKKLTGFESPDKGYEWFGESPAHEALTAYGLMEFVDMAKVMPVDENMIERTRDWLLTQRDGKGSFKRNESALDSFGGAPAPTTDAYIIWSLLESGEDPRLLKTEIKALKEEAQKTDDTYVIALAANVFYIAGDKKIASTLSKRLAEAVGKTGSVADSLTSITRSGGESLDIETTSLALLAWLKDDAKWAAQVEVSMRWLFEQSKAGRFGSTQSTVLALKAINVYDAARAKPEQAGSVQLFIDDRPFAAPAAFEKDTKGAIELADLSAALSSGQHTIGLKMSDGSKMPFALEIVFNTSLPVSSDTGELALKTTLSSAALKEGEPLEIQLDLRVGSEDAPTPVAIIGIPGGLQVRHDQLKELVGANRINAYEVIGSELVLYWRALKAGEKRVIPLAFNAAIPGTYTGPASRAYLYYTDENKVWEKGQTVTVEAL